MALHIANQAKHLLIIPLNSGKAVHLAPGESSHPIEELEINANEKVAKLLKANLVAILKVSAEETPKEEPRKKKPAKAKKSLKIK